jgi:hypothetical protein
MMCDAVCEHELFGDPALTAGKQLKGLTSFRAKATSSKGTVICAFLHGPTRRLTCVHRSPTYQTASGRQRLALNPTSRTDRSHHSG